jgi:hypothetical protein
MIRPLTFAVAALSVLGASVASAQVLVPSEPGYGDEPYTYRGPVVVEPYAAYQDREDRSNSWYGATSGQCSTDEGYGRRGTCATGGGG